MGQEPKVEVVAKVGVDRDYAEARLDKHGIVSGSGEGGLLLLAWPEKKDLLTELGIFGIF